MFKVRLQNFASVPTEHASYDEALTRAKSIGFEATIWYEPSDNEFCLVASYSPLYGLHVHHRILAGMEPGLTMADAVAINGIPVK